MQENLPYKNPALSVEERVQDLISRMTLAEKIGQLLSTRGFTTYEKLPDGTVAITQELKDLYAKYPGAGLGSFFRADWHSGRNWSNGITPDLLASTFNLVQKYAVENTRLGIPITAGGSIHGLQVLGGIVFPTGIGQAATFDRNIVAQAASDCVEELQTFTPSTHMSGPTQDLARDPRWSRTEETFGEDPFLSAELTYAFCDGIRQKDGKHFGGALRHFIAHGESEGGRMSSPVHIGKNELFNNSLRPYYWGIQGGAVTIMTCYNLVDGIPGSMNDELVQGLLRDKWGFEGIINGDAGAIGGLVWQGFANDLGDAATLFLRSGQDTCCWEDANLQKGLELALGRGQLKPEELDIHVARVLRSKLASGLFEHPYITAEDTVKYGKAEDVLSCRKHRDTALQMARELMTLLKNDKNVLPLNPQKIKRLAVIGPNADKPENQIGDYSAPQRPGDVVTPRMGFEALGKKYGFEVEYRLGCKVRWHNKDGFADAIAAAKRSDAVVVCLGGSSIPDQALTQNEAGTALNEHVKTDTTLDKDGGEGFDRATLCLNGVQQELLKELKKTGKPIITVLIIGRALVLTDILASSDALLYAWYPGMEGGTAIAETVFGLNAPAGRLPVSFPRKEGALPCFYNVLRLPSNYVDVEASALFPFGYGMSYTTFDYTAPVVDDNTVSSIVTNTGKIASDEVVQLYISDLKFSIARPLLELKGFERIHLQPGESRKISFHLTSKELGFYNRKLEYVVEPGDFKLSIGGSSESLKSCTYTYNEK